MINKTPEGQLGKYLIGDLAVARRHLERIRQGILPAEPMVLEEISDAIERCVKRITRDIGD